VLASLAPNNRICSANEGIFLGPVDNDDDEKCSLPICVQYLISGENSLYYSTDPEGTLQLQTLIDGNITDNFNYPRGFDDFQISPETNLAIS